MFSEGQKRRASLNILEKLRSQGMPERSDEADEGFDNMFAKVDEEGKVVPGGEGEGESTEEEKKKKKKAYERGEGETRQPAANQPGAKAFMDSFKKTK